MYKALTHIVTIDSVCAKMTIQTFDPGTIFTEKNDDQTVSKDIICMH